MSFLQKWLTKQIEAAMHPDKEYIVPPDSFCGVFDDDAYCLQILTSGRHMISDKYTVSPPILLDTHTITIGYPYQNNHTKIFYKLAVNYKITDPYLYLVNADRGEYVSAEVASLVSLLLWNKNEDEIKTLIGNEYIFEGVAADTVFNALDKYGVKVFSASCVLSSIEEIRSVPHDDKMLTENVEYIRGYFHNSTGLSEDDLPN